MLTATKALRSLTAADLMSTDVVLIPLAMSLQGAAHLLSQAHITGAPVINAEGRCVGVISATDFVNWAEKGEHAAHWGEENCACAHSAWQVIESDPVAPQTVAGYMTPDPVTVEPRISIGELARKMVDAHIHRVIVVDEQERPIGVVSSMDILGAVGFEDRKLSAREYWRA